MNEAVGVCIGASTISFVKAVRSDDGLISIDSVSRVPHNGSPKSVLSSHFTSFNSNAIPTVVTGRKFRNLLDLTAISEPEATELAFSYLIKKYRHQQLFTGIASLGGETFMVYTLDDEKKITNVISKNQCASGTGEFFLQQLKRVDMDLEDFAAAPLSGDPFKVSGRCSVFCKSDCTHALNKGVPKNDVTSGLALMMAEKIEELLTGVRAGQILAVGGVTSNKGVMSYLQKKTKNIVIPEEAPYFEALGAAIYGLQNTVRPITSFSDIFLQKNSSFQFHQPLRQFQPKVKFHSLEVAVANDGDRCILGLDVGSTTTKAVLLRCSDNAVVGKVYLYTHGNPIKASRSCYEELLRQVPQNISIIGIGTTGSGRQIAGLHALTHGIVNEIIAHATAATHFDPAVDTIYEIGGQDAKYTFLVNGVPADYAMNEACSAGTGSFIEEAALEALGVSLHEIEPMAMSGDTPPNFSDQCSAFISSDIKTALQENLSKENVISGLVYSICLNYVNRVRGTRQVGDKIFMQGGVCYNKAIPIAMAALTGSDIIVPPEPGLMGAFGVALEIKNRITLGVLPEGNYSLTELFRREVTYKDPFICAGGKEKCDRQCSINRIEVLGRTYPFGGACNKYYNTITQQSFETARYDYVQRRHKATFIQFAPQAELPPQSKSVGINQSFHTHTLYPLYYNFFTRLGFRVVLSDTVEEDTQHRELTSYCYPCQLSIGLFQNLLLKETDYIFVPQILEMQTGDEGYQRMDFNCTCAFLSEEPLFLQQAYKDKSLKGRFVAPILNFANGLMTQQAKFVETARSMGILDETMAAEAYCYAVQMQNSYQEHLFSLGKEVLQLLDSNPDAIAMVLIGRPYNSFTDLANKGIPQKFASRGVFVVPFDLFDYRKEKVDEDQYWEGSKKILKAAKIIIRHPKLFATYISNYSCAPDSMTIPQFRKIIGSKPTLTLELDGHTADAGINTRIDAALDIIQNYRKLQVEQVQEEKPFSIATVQLEGTASFIVGSDGEKIPLNDPRVVVIIPSMGDLSVQLFAANLRSYGYNAVALPEGNDDILRYGRANATGKECLPLLLLAGSLLDFLENRWDKKSYVAYLIAQGAGNCRLGQYPVFLRDMIKRKKLRNVATMVLMNENGFAGLGPDIALTAIQSLIAADVLDDIRSGIMANSEDPSQGLRIFQEEFNELIKQNERVPQKLPQALKRFSRSIHKRIPAKIKIKDSKYIAMVGEIYVRRDHFAHKYLNRRFAEKGFILKDAYLTEWIFYVDYLLKLELLEPDTSFKHKYERTIRLFFMRLTEYRVKKILERSGYYKFALTDIDSVLKHSKHIIPLDCKGEPGLTLGIALHETIEKYCGVVNIGPFGCMPTRFAEAVSLPEMNIKNKIKAKRINDPSYTLPEMFNEEMNLPFLTIETDGTVYPQAIEARIETFLLHAERLAQLMKKMRKQRRPSLFWMKAAALLGLAK
ncbi:MAG: acyl-CoA dehydratase activase [Bacteroidota bacterium]